MTNNVFNIPICLRYLYQELGQEKCFQLLAESYKEYNPGGTFEDFKGTGIVLSAHQLGIRDKINKIMSAEEYNGLSGKPMNCEELAHNNPGLETYCCLCHKSARYTNAFKSQEERVLAVLCQMNAYNDYVKNNVLSATMFTAQCPVYPDGKLVLLPIHVKVFSHIQVVIKSGESVDKAQLTEEVLKDELLFAYPKEVTAIIQSFFSITIRMDDIDVWFKELSDGRQGIVPQANRVELGKGLSRTRREKAPPKDKISPGQFSFHEKIDEVTVAAITQIQSSKGADGEDRNITMPNSMTHDESLNPIEVLSLISSAAPVNEITSLDQYREIEWALKHGGVCSLIFMNNPVRVLLTLSSKSNPVRPFLLRPDELKEEILSLLKSDLLIKVAATLEPLSDIWGVAVYNSKRLIAIDCLEQLLDKSFLFMDIWKTERKSAGPSLESIEDSQKEGILLLDRYEKIKSHIAFKEDNSTFGALIEKREGNEIFDIEKRFPYYKRFISLAKWDAVSKSLMKNNSAKLKRLKLRIMAGHLLSYANDFKFPSKEMENIGCINWVTEQVFVALSASRLAQYGGIFLIDVSPGEIQVGYPEQWHEVIYENLNYLGTALFKEIVSPRIKPFVVMEEVYD